MSKDTVTIYKFFWAHQDVEQEQWLRAKAKEGLHLLRVPFVCGWVFRKGPPQDVVYRIDFRNRDDGYKRLFEDAGWECAGGVAGWHYWRRKAVAGVADEIFTDNESKIGKYRRVLMLLAVGIMPLTVMLLLSGPERFLSGLSQPTMLVFGTLITLGYPMYLYAALGLYKRIRTLRNQEA